MWRRNLRDIGHKNLVRAERVIQTRRTSSTTTSNTISISCSFGAELALRFHWARRASVRTSDLGQSCIHATTDPHHRKRPGKRHVVTRHSQLMLVVTLTGASRNGALQRAPLLQQREHKQLEHELEHEDEQNEQPELCARLGQSARCAFRGRSAPLCAHFARVSLAIHATTDPHHRKRSSAKRRRWCIASKFKQMAPVAASSANIGQRAVAISVC